MARVVVLDDDPATVDGYCGVLRNAGFEVRGARSASEGLAIIQETPVDLVLADLRLGEASALEVLQRLQEAQIHVRLVIVTGFATIQVTVEAMRLGACDVVEKPLVGDEVVTVVERNLLSGRHVVASCDNLESHAAARLASAIIPLLSSPRDPKNLRGWSRSIAASPGAIKNWCRTANLKPRTSLTFARLLRAVLRRRDGVNAANLIDVVDKRTLVKLFRAAGLTPDSSQWPSSVEGFLERQQLIRDPDILNELRRALQSGLPLSSFFNESSRVMGSTVKAKLDSAAASTESGATTSDFRGGVAFQETTLDVPGLPQRVSN